MSTRVRILGLGLGLLLCSLGASAQGIASPEPPAAPAPELVAATEPPAEPLLVAVPERAKQQADYLADALQLKARQAAVLRAALQTRLDAAEILSHMLFASAPVATAAFDDIDYRYYAAMGKVLTPSQFHKLLQLDEQATSVAETPMVLRGR